MKHLITRKRRLLAGIAVLALTSVSLLATQTSPKFFPDDPLVADPESQDASRAAQYELDLYLDLILDSFAKPGDKVSPSPKAGNVNTIDEVPDSGWFTNRILARPISTEDLLRGAGEGKPPNPASWTITAGKSAGVTPGFTAMDADGETWFISFDGPENVEAGSGAIMVANRIFHALGYWQGDNRLTEVNPARVTIGEKATIRGRNGKRRRFTPDDLEKVFQRSAASADGTYRAAAARLIRGKVLGNFRYYGSRTDDPNDLVLHEHRRELRALKVFGAWTNLVDLKGGNNLDVVVDKGGHGVIRHYLQDVGSTFGTGAYSARDWDEGWEPLFDTGKLGRRLVTFGWALPVWATVRYDEVPGVGRFEGDVFDPKTWSPRAPVAAFRHLRADDAFWAARRVMAFSDEMIRNVVKVGEYSHPRAEKVLANALIKRRDKIGRAYYADINPLIDFKLSEIGELTFSNAALDAKVADAPKGGYQAAWSLFDNSTRDTKPLGESQSSVSPLRAPAGLPSAAGAYLKIEIRGVDAPHDAWEQPVHVYFRREPGSWKLVGLERLP